MSEPIEEYQEFDREVKYENSSVEATPFSLFSFSGCVSRQTYWAVSAVSISAAMIPAVAIAVVVPKLSALTISQELISIMMLLPFVLFVWISLATSIKRFRDANFSPWLALLNIIPYLGSLIVLILNGFFPSVDKANIRCKSKSKLSAKAIRLIYIVFLAPTLLLFLTIALQKLMVKDGSTVTEEVTSTVACDSRDAEGCYDLGYMYLYGKGVKRDDSKAAELYKKACDGDFSLGCSGLGELYILGNGVKENHEKSAELFQKAAELHKKACDSGIARECYYLGFCYTFHYRGVKQDHFKAAELYKKACDGGDINGCLSLGLMYADGEFVRQDSFKAIEFYKKACDGGSADGCFSIGVIYANGEGIKQNSQKALEFYGKACDLKDEHGCKEYAKLKKLLRQ